MELIKILNEFGKPLAELMFCENCLNVDYFNSRQEGLKQSNGTHV